MFFGVFNLPWWGDVAVALVLTHVTIVAVTVCVHRHQAHRALDLHPVAQRLASTRNGRRETHPRRACAGESRG